MKIIIKTVVLVSSVFAAFAVNAAFLTLTPSVPTVVAGDIFSIELYLDASDAPGQHPSADLSGRVALQFDSEFIDFTGFAYSAPAIELEAVNVTTLGSDDIVTFGFENATDVGFIGTYSFIVNDSPDPLPALGSIFNFDAYDAKVEDFFDSFSNELGSNQTFPLTPEVASTSVSVVPLPAPLLLLLSAFAALLPSIRAGKKR